MLTHLYTSIKNERPLHCCCNSNANRSNMQCRCCCYYSRALKWLHTTVLHLRALLTVQMSAWGTAGVSVLFTTTRVPVLRWSTACWTGPCSCWRWSLLVGTVTTSRLLMVRRLGQEATSRCIMKQMNGALTERCQIISMLEFILWAQKVGSNIIWDHGFRID